MSIRDELNEIILNNTGKGANEAMCADRVDREAVTEQMLAKFTFIRRSHLPKNAPYIALELLTAAGYTATSHASPDPLVWVSNAVRDLDAWEEASERQNAINQGRNDVSWEIAKETYGPDAPLTPYAELSRSMQTAIDRIIELRQTQS